MAELYLVEFKGSRKEYFFNAFYHNISPSDYVITQAERGEDIGVVLKKIDVEVDFSESDRPRSTLRPSSKDDLERYRLNLEKDQEHQGEVVAMIKRHGLVMKVVDVETQHDGNKMTIFFTADHRVDFRELVKELASRFKTRIELRQIGVRDEARRIGGYGVCGRQQCCNAFIKDFSPISTQHAREQDLPMNPAKISGNCGRLLCCLRYEVGLYTKVKSRFPSAGTLVKTKNGDGVIVRIDIFKEEAVVRNDENLFFRITPKDIISTESGRRKFVRAASSDYEEKSDTSETELRELDDSENVN